MEESSAPKPVLEFNFKAEVDNDIFNIILTQNYENCEHLIIKISQTNAIPPTSYEAKFTKKDLDTTSRYFKIVFSCQTTKEICVTKSQNRDLWHPHQIIISYCRKF